MKVQGDLATAAAFSTPQKSFLSAPPVLHLSPFFIFCCSPLEMSSSRQTCNGGQPQRRESVCGVEHCQILVFFAFWQSDHVICVPALIESSTNLEMSGKHCQQSQGGLIRNETAIVQKGG